MPGHTQTRSNVAIQQLVRTYHIVVTRIQKYLQKHHLASLPILTTDEILGDLDFTTQRQDLFVSGIGSGELYQNV